MQGIAKKFTPMDLVIIFSFIFFACLYQINRVAGNNLFLFHNSDADNVASFAAAKDHPGLFSGDGFLADQRNFGFYSTIHIPIIRFLCRFTGDYASPLTLLVGLHIFLQALGFYIFGCIIFQSRYWAAVLAAVTLMFVPLAVGDFWGMYFDVLPRTTFHAVLPYLLAAVFYWQSRPSVWVWLFVFSGITVYIHPPSAPCWGLAIWLGLWMLQPPFWKLKKRLFFMFFLGIIFLAISYPFFTNFIGHRNPGPAINYELMSEIMKFRLARGLLNPLYALGSFISNLTYFRVLIFGFIGILYVFLNFKTERKKILVIGLWIIGIFIISIVFTSLMLLISTINKVIPIGFELVRNLKYTFPLLLTFCLWPFVVMSRNLATKRKRRLAFVIGTLLFFIWCSRQMYKHIIFLNKNGYFIFNPDKGNTSEILDILNAIRRLVPEKAGILSLSSIMRDSAVRYYALRPLVYSGKEGAAFAVFNRPDDAMEWYRKTRALADRCRLIKDEEDEKTKIKLIFDLSRNFKAEYLLVDRDIIPYPVSSFGADDIVYYNNLFMLIKIKPD